MFVKPRIIIVLLFSICITYGQNYRSVDEIKDDWLEHTKFQKQELLSFCDFLINEGHYERALLSLFHTLRIKKNSGNQSNGGVPNVNMPK